jgi:hypothetical protein
MVCQESMSLTAVNRASDCTDGSSETRSKDCGDHKNTRTSFFILGVDQKGHSLALSGDR